MLLDGKTMNIFVVEDDAWYNKYLTYHLSESPNYNVYSFTTAKDVLNKTDVEPDIICLDYFLPDMESDILIPQIKNKYSTCSIILISSLGDVEKVINVMKLGIDDYIVKNEHTINLLENSISNIAEKIHLVKELKVLKEFVDKKINNEKSLIGESKQISILREKIKTAALTNMPITIIGEIGTGKKIIAKMISKYSNIKSGNFIEVNGLTILDENLDLFLFGSEKNSKSSKFQIGLFEKINNGVLYISNFSSSSIKFQKLFLKVINENAIKRIGSEVSIPIEFKLIISNQTSLNEALTEGKILEELFYKTIGITLEIPPLRQRTDDIPHLVDYFLTSYAQVNNKNKKTISNQALNTLKTQEYKGNVRELKAIVDLACILSNEQIEEKDVLQNNDLSSEINIDKHKTLRELNEEIISKYYLKYKNISFISQKLDISRASIYNYLKKKPK